MAEAITDGLLYQKEAQVLLDAVTDKTTRDLVGAFLATVYREAQSGCPPRTDLDFEFVVRTVIGFCEQHDLIRSIVTGGEIGAWPE